MAVRLLTVDEKGALQNIATVLCNPKLRIGVEVATDVKLVCSSFSRDPLILELGNDNDDGSTLSASRTTGIIGLKRINIFCDDVSERTRLLKFGAYLRERNKAGICRYESEDIYLLPPPVGAELIQCVMMPHKIVHAPIPSAVPIKRPVPASGIQKDHSSGAKLEHKRLNNDASGSIAKPGLSLIASIASRASAGVDARAANQASKLAKQQISNNMERLEADLHIKLEAFCAQISNVMEGQNAHVTELRLEPMDKDQRYVVHDVVTHYPELVSASVGDMEDRHVVVYKRGCQPPDVEIHVSKAELRPQQPRFASRSATANGAGAGKILMVEASDEGGLVTLNTVKKDRRTIEELRRDGAVAAAPNKRTKRE
jgi:hypothetical protein